MMLLSLILLEYYTCIVTTKTEGVAKTSTYDTLLSLVECEVQVVINLWILITFLVIDCWRNDIVLDSQNGSHCLNSTSSTKKVTSHRLGRRDVELVGSIAEYLLDSLSLRDITNVGKVPCTLM